ncbi:MAG: OmpA family protein [Bacteroidota bacterium]
MRKFIPALLALSVFALTFTTSCVPKRKLTAANERVRKLQSDSSMTHSELNDCNTKVKGLTSEKMGLLGDKAKLQNENANTLNELENVTNQSNMTIAQQQQRLESLQRLINSQRDAMNRLRQTVADALINFKADELSVYVKDGNVYVSLQEKLLFKSGSAVVDPKGKDALGTLAKVLNNTPNINVMIEGHTDSIPIKTTMFPDNWALSTARATSIVRILSKDYGVDAHRLVASGKGEFYPVKSNSSPDGRAGNRRTEIILSPNLNELYELLK